jgi:hypothetical protein
MALAGVANTWYLKRATDAWEQNDQPEAYFRLLAPDFTPQPVYDSIKAYTASITPTLYAGAHQEEPLGAALQPAIGSRLDDAQRGAGPVHADQRSPGRAELSVPGQRL